MLYATSAPYTPVFGIKLPQRKQAGPKPAPKPAPNPGPGRMTAEDWARLGGLLTNVPLYTGTIQAMKNLHAGDVRPGAVALGVAVASVCLREAFFRNAESND
jgi:hypothetical protein